jgi:hypothetical protein
MTDTPESTAKTRTIGKVSVAKLAKNKTWLDFVKKSEIAAKANTDHEQAKAAMREFFKQSLGLEAEVQIDFSKNSDGTLTIVEKFEKKTNAPRVATCWMI